MMNISNVASMALAFGAQDYSGSVEDLRNRKAFESQPGRR